MNKEKEKTNLTFKKARGQLAKVLDMMEKDQYCIDIMQQNLALIGLLKSAHQALLEQHLHHCFTDAMAAKDTKKKHQMAEEILQVTKLAHK